MKVAVGQVQLGDVIDYYLSRQGGYSTPLITECTHRATVIALPKNPLSQSYFVIGWKEEPSPFAGWTRTSSVASSAWNAFDLISDHSEYTHYDIFSYNHAEMVGIVGKSISQAQELPCVGCGKMNDVGVQSCWWCGGALK